MSIKSNDKRNLIEIQAMCQFISHPPPFFMFMDCKAPIESPTYRMTEIKKITGISDIKSLEEVLKEPEVQNYIIKYNWTIKFDIDYDYEIRPVGCDCFELAYPAACICKRPTKRVVSFHQNSEQ